MANCALVFDVDGTLVDSRGAWLLAANSIIRDHSTGRPVDFYDVSRYAVSGTSGLVEYINDCVKFDSKLLFWDRVYGEYVSAIRRIVDIRKIISRFGGAYICIFTNKSRENFKRLLTVFPELNEVDLILCPSDKIPRKPNPTGLRWIASSLGVHRDRVCMIGDTIDDIQCASAAGSVSVCCSFGYGQEISSLPGQGMLTVARSEAELYFRLEKAIGNI